MRLLPSASTRPRKFSPSASSIIAARCSSARVLRRAAFERWAGCTGHVASWPWKPAAARITGAATSPPAVTSRSLIAAEFVGAVPPGRQERRQRCAGHRHCCAPAHHALRADQDRRAAGHPVVAPRARRLQRRAHRADQPRCAGCWPSSAS
ncbi:MAG: hypothetical protein MZW92_18945 [Comamonadaceae bacterium]|nr:hypothetical protein [Comamonadaceae bacterium]